MLIYSQSETVKERDYFGDLGLDGRIILKFTLKERDVSMQTGFVLPRIGTSDELL
jgi:hypothetical protein